jgi:hypothetical protein
MPKQQVKSSEQPPAIGYIRLDDHDDNEFAVLLKDIATCCLREGLRLIRTFYDQGNDGSTLARPGVVELRQALQYMPGLVVIVPTLDHLSPADSIRSPLLLMIHKFGGKLLVANEPNGKTGRLRRHAVRDVDWAGRRARALVMAVLWWFVGALAAVFELWFGLLVWTSNRDRWPRR